MTRFTNPLIIIIIIIIIKLDNNTSHL